MYMINLSIPATLSLYVNSISGSNSDDIIEEDDIVEEGEDNDALSMSDEEFEKLSEEDFTSDTDVDDKEDEDEDLGNETEDEPEEKANEDEPTDTAVDVGSEQAEEEGKSEEGQPNEEDKKIETANNEKAINDAFELLYGTPIKASGREVQLRNPEHADRFIKMGIDYNKKMHSMKPHLATLKTLEKRGLLADDKIERLNLLLEVESGNKDALKRLIAESDIDPLDLADEEVIEEGKNYQPQNHIISQAEVEIEEALNSIEGSPSQARTLDVMTKQFDAKSRQVISENPHYIVALNDDIESGVYDKVMETAQYRRDMGQVNPTVSDMELYLSIVSEAAQNQPAPAPTINKQPAQPKPSNGPNRRRRTAMGGSRSSNKPAKKEYDPMEVMSMSDDDFEKKFGAELL